MVKIESFENASRSTYFLRPVIRVADVAHARGVSMLWLCMVASQFFERSVPTLVKTLSYSLIA
jgi:hypothetical protein